MMHFDPGTDTMTARSRLAGRRRVADALVKRNLAAAGYPADTEPHSPQRGDIGLALARIRDRSRPPAQPVQFAFNETANAPGVAPRALDYGLGRATAMPLHSPAGPTRADAPGRYSEPPVHQIGGDAPPIGQPFGTGAILDNGNSIELEQERPPSKNIGRETNIYRRLGKAASRGARQRWNENDPLGLDVKSIDQLRDIGWFSEDAPVGMINEAVYVPTIRLVDHAYRLANSGIGAGAALANQTLQELGMSPTSARKFERDLLLLSQFARGRLGSVPGHMTVPRYLINKYMYGMGRDKPKNQGK